MEESCDDDVARYKASGVFVVPVVVKRERERVDKAWPSRLRPSDGSVLFWCVQTVITCYNNWKTVAIEADENMRVNKRSSSGRMMGPQSITHKNQKNTTHPGPSVAKAPAEPAEILIPCLFFCISFYRWWTSIIFITRRTNCWARPVNNSWASRWRRSSKRFCRRSKDTCEQY